MEPSIVGFKYKSADLHRKSPKIFAASMIVSAFLTAVIINLSFTLNPPDLKKTERLPFVINMEKIPETPPAASSAAPPRPFVETGTPIEIDDDIMPDEIVVETLPDPSVEFSESAETAPGAVNDNAAAAESGPAEEVPRKLNEVVPVYPDMAERAGIEGAVELKVLVGVNGTVDSVVVLEGPAIFIESAIDAAKRTRFVPAKYYGEPVECWILMPYRFIRDE